MLTSESVNEPIPISKIAGRYLLFDINVVTYLRRTHNICGVLIGSIPQIPQQNVFLGLPIELLPEEARLLVDKKVAYIVDDTIWHKQRLTTLDGADRKKYLESLRSEGRRARKTAEGNSQKKAEIGLAKRALMRASKDGAKYEEVELSTTRDRNHESDSLFESTRSSSPAPSSPNTSSSGPYTVTPTATHTVLLPSREDFQATDPVVPSSFPLFAHLHSLDYFITPGLRFGCDYTVYPGDPLRFHSHFLAVGYDWDEEIPLLDLIGGGRLGTGVKKGFLIGGENTATSQNEGACSVRTFCIEWGGM